MGVHRCPFTFDPFFTKRGKTFVHETLMRKRYFVVSQNVSRLSKHATFAAEGSFVSEKQKPFPRLFR